MDAEDWLKGVKKKLVIAQCMDHEKVLFASHQLYGTAANWWATYCNTHANVDTITWNEFKARFHTHYVPRGTMKLKRKEFVDLKQGDMTVNEYSTHSFSCQGTPLTTSTPTRRSRMSS
jgi:hypothetical protein